MTKKQWIADGLLLAAAIIWGSAFAVVKNTLDSVPPSMMIALRFGIAALISGVILRKHLRGLTRGQVLMGLLVGVLTGLAYIVQTIGLQDTTAGKNAFLTTIYVLLVPFGSAVLFHEKLGARRYVAAVLMLLGIGILSLDGESGGLNRGDVLTLIEKAENTISQKDAEKMAKKLEENRFDMDDLLEQLRQIQKMGSLKSIIGMLPGVGSKLKDADIDDRQFVRIEAMITSMTRAERAKPSIITPSRKRRIAAGSGTKVEDVNRLLKQFDQMQKMMKQLGGKAGKGGKMNRRAMKRLANMNPEQLQSLQGGIPGVPPGLMPPKK